VRLPFILKFEIKDIRLFRVPLGSIIPYSQVPIRIFEVVDEPMDVGVFARIEAKVLVFTVARPLKAVLHCD